MRILLVGELFYHQQLRLSSQQLVIVLSHILSPVWWLVPRGDQLGPIGLSSYHEKSDPLLGTSMVSDVLSLIISLFVRILDDYLMVMAESPQTDAFKAVLSTMVQTQDWFGFRTKSHLEVTTLWCESHGSSNGFGNNLWRKYKITMATMTSLQKMNSKSVVMTKVKIRFFKSWCLASECKSRTWNTNHNVYGAGICNAHIITLSR